MKTIDFRASAWNCRPRMLWQALFDFYRENGGDLSSLDNLLVDYENCKKLFGSTSSATFLWGFYGRRTTWIDSKNFWIDPEHTAAASFCDHYLLVEVKEDEAVVSEVKEAVL